MRRTAEPELSGAKCPAPRRRVDPTQDLGFHRMIYDEAPDRIPHSEIGHLWVVFNYTFRAMAVLSERNGSAHFKRQTQLGSTRSEDGGR